MAAVELRVQYDVTTSWTLEELNGKGEGIGQMTELWKRLDWEAHCGGRGLEKSLRGAYHKNFVTLSRAIGWIPLM